MTQAAAATGTPAAPQPPAPAPAAPPTGDMLSVSRDSIPQEFGGDWHKAMSAAKGYQTVEPYAQIIQQAQQLGVTPEFLAELLSGYAQAPPANAQPPQGLTVEQLNQWAKDHLMPQLQEQFGTVLSQRDEQYRTLMDRQRAMDQGAKGRDEAIDKFLGEIGYPRANEKGEPNRWGEIFYRETLDSLFDVMGEGAPEKPDEQSLYYAQPSPEHMQAALEKVAWLKDAPAELAATIAQRQQTQPSETLGEGPTGRPAPKKWDDMSPEERRQDYVAQHPEANEGED